MTNEIRRMRTKEQIIEDIKRLKAELKKTDDLKRRTFIKATINSYSKAIGRKEPFTW